MDHDRRNARLETLVLLHTGLMLVFTTWAFGGNIQWAQPPLRLWGAVGALLTAGLLWERRRARSGRLARPLLWLAPALMLNALVVASVFNPSFARVPFFESEVFRPVPAIDGLPSHARPDLALARLWLYDSLYLAGFNLLLAVRRRGLLRLGGFVLASNALALAVFGTAQKLLGTDIYFGLEQSPNPAFFSTFFYHNHWGPFALMMSALCLGLVFHLARDEQHRSFWQSPAFTLLIVAFFLAATVPLSTSRSSTAALSVLLLGALGHAVVLIGRRRRAAGQPVTAALVFTVSGALVAASLIYKLGEPVIVARLDKTREQLAEIRTSGSVGRTLLYQDTWRMAQDRLTFGWGLGAYPTVFMRYNTQEPKRDRLPVFYREAHSDWLQALAEIGAVGVLLLVLMGLLPGLSVWRTALRYPFPAYLFAACTLVMLYACVEFPYANPAVTLTFWVCLFGAVRYAQLSET